MALTGFSVHNTCYSTLVEARDAYFSGISATIVSSGRTVYYQFNKVTNIWQRVDVSFNGVPVYSVAPVPSFQPCDPLLGFTDGLATSALVSGALIIASIWGIMARAK